MPHDGYNIYVAGLTGSGKTSMVKSYIKRAIAEREARKEPFELEDWCYLYNFQEPDRPQIISLPQGKGKKFRDQIAELLAKVKEDIGKAFSQRGVQVSGQETS
jgi:Cdc6-like AAA superfamily ATPase